MKQESNGPEKWYNTEFFRNIGKGFYEISKGVAIAAVIIGIGYGLRGCEGPNLADVEMQKIRSGYVIERHYENGELTKRIERAGPAADIENLVE